MKFSTIVFLFITFSTYSQHDSGQTQGLFISGLVVLTDNDTVSKNRLGLIRNLETTEKDNIRPFDIDTEGYFKIDKLSSGSYELLFKVNQDYHNRDTMLTLSTNSIYDLKVKLFKRPCDYDARRDINDNLVKILVSSGTSPSINTRGDNSFEKRFKISYVVLGDARTESFSCLKKYNDTVFQFLDDQYGGKWRKRVRNDAIGFEQIQ